MWNVCLTLEYSLEESRVPHRECRIYTVRGDRHHRLQSVLRMRVATLHGLVREDPSKEGEGMSLVDVRVGGGEN